MHSSEESDFKINTAKSFNIQSSSSIKMKSGTTKRKSFDLNDAVRSLDLAYRLKKSKLVNGECLTASSSPTSQKKRTYPNMLMDVSSSATCPGIDNSSLMSMNFSHYELMRNLSSSLSNSDEAFSGTTCSVRMGSPDNNMKNEHLERYFRSVEIWSQKYRDGHGNGINLQGVNK